MSEMIVKLNQDRVKINGCEYVGDLIRCKDCRNWNVEDKCPCVIYRYGDRYITDLGDDGFCSWAEPKEEE